jgi:hypothetical protein
VDFPIKNGDFPVRYVKLPEGKPSSSTMEPSKSVKSLAPHRHPPGCGKRPRWDVPAGHSAGPVFFWGENGEQLSENWVFNGFLKDL